MCSEHVSSYPLHVKAGRQSGRLCQASIFMLTCTGSQTASTPCTIGSVLSHSPCTRGGAHSSPTHTLSLLMRFLVCRWACGTTCPSYRLWTTQACSQPKQAPSRVNACWGAQMLPCPLLYRRLAAFSRCVDQGVCAVPWLVFWDRPCTGLVGQLRLLTGVAQTAACSRLMSYC